MTDTTVANTAYDLAADAPAKPTATASSTTTEPYGKKLGHSCCGGCCDMRRAVIVVNLIYLGMTAWGLMVALLLKSYATAQIQNGYDNATQAMIDENPELEQSYQDMADLPLVQVLVHNIVIALGCLIGVFGSLHYRIEMVGAAGLMYLVIAGMALVVSPFSMILPLFFAYPHFFYITENRKGTLTAQNYHNEKQSCCCV
jgi:hypothetical protein